MIFRYNSEKFKKVHVLRTASVVGIYLFVFFFNYLRLGEQYKGGYLRIFLPLTLFLMFFLYRNFKKQLKVLNDSYVEIKDQSLKQYSWNGNSLEINLNQLVSVRKDMYRMYERIILEDRERFIYLVNLQDSEKLIAEVEKISGLKTETVAENKQDSLKKLLISFLPSILIIAFFAVGELPLKTAALVFNANLVLWLIYQERTTLNRKLLFASMAGFVFQIYLAVL